MKYITILYYDDWSVMYGIDGLKKEEGYDIELDEFFEYLQDIKEHPLNIGIKYIHCNDRSELEEEALSGRTPDLLVDAIRMNEAI